MQIYSPHNIDFEEISADKDRLNAFADKISALNEGLRNILLSADTPYFLEALCLTYGLSEEQSANLSRVVRDLIFGDVKPTNAVKEISSRLKLDQATSQTIESEIDRGLFNKIRQKTTAGTTQLPPQTKNTPLVNQSNVIDLRNQS